MGIRLLQRLPDIPASLALGSLAAALAGFLAATFHVRFSVVVTLAVAAATLPAIITFIASAPTDIAVIPRPTLSRRSLYRHMYSRRIGQQHDERRDLVTEVRRQKGSDTWHLCSNCSNWPTSNYDTTSYKPTMGELCNECLSLLRKGNCKEEL